MAVVKFSVAGWNHGSCWMKLYQLLDEIMVIVGGYHCSCWMKSWQLLDGFLQLIDGIMPLLNGIMIVIGLNFDIY